MGDWNRSTSKKTLDQIQPAHWRAIQEHLESYNLKLDLEDYLMCIETISHKKKWKLFGYGMPKQTIQFVILTPKWLFLSVEGDKPDSVGVLSIQLKDAVAEDYKDSPSYKLVQDNAINLTGIYTGRVGMHGNARISSMLVLGEEPAAAEFKEILFKSIADAKQ